MQLINMLYVDDKIDLFVSQYLSEYSNDKARYEYLELKFESNFCWFSEDIFGKIPVQISIIFCTQKTERQKFIDFGQNILWALCEWNAMINTLKYTK